MVMKTRIYVGCSLTHAPTEFRESIKKLKEELRKDPQYEILEFFGTEGGTAVDVYEHDIHNCVENCDAFLCDVTYPSLGLGWEMGTVVEKRKIPTLAVARRDAIVGRLIIGAENERNPFFSFRRYDDIMEVVEYVKNLVSHVHGV